MSLALRILFVFSLLGAQLSSAQEYAINDILPWPWGSECPFPWTKIEGEWVSRGEGSTDHFVFTIRGRQPDGSRSLAIERYNKNGEMIGMGQGVGPRGERIVRAAMVGLGPEEGKAYWAIVRTYTEMQKKSCSRSKQVTVITLKSAERAEEEVHYVLDREEAVRKAKN